MLEKLIDDKPFLAVLFYGEDCDECNEVLKELEVNICQMLSSLLLVVTLKNE